MNVIADVCIVPIGQGVSVSQEVAECQKIIDASGLQFQMHGYGTNIEGEWDAVFSTIKKCHQHLHDSGVVRITSSLRLGTRTDKVQTVSDKITAVENILKGES